MELNEEFIATRTSELFIARILSEMAGALTGEQVVAAHKCVVNKVCKDKRGWDLLACIVDNMERMYRLVREVGYERAMVEMTCGELIPR